jgi:hypothetical protein
VHLLIPVVHPAKAELIVRQFWCQIRRLLCIVVLHFCRNARPSVRGDGPLKEIAGQGSSDTYCGTVVYNETVRVRTLKRPSAIDTVCFVAQCIVVLIVLF